MRLKTASPEVAFRKKADDSEGIPLRLGVLAFIDFYRKLGQEINLKE